jgi:hypothetical protein
VKDYGLFLTDEDPKKGVWLEPARSLEYYLLRNGVSYSTLFLLKLYFQSFKTFSNDQYFIAKNQIEFQFFLQ